MTQKIVIVDYGMGNIHSISKKLKGENIKVIVSNDSNVILNSDKIILPGVGHFAKAIQNLQKLNLITALNEAVLINKKPILGICLGLQLMTKKSEEGSADGLGWFDAEVQKFNIKNPFINKVPHTGWNKITVNKTSRIMTNINDEDEFYFVHSYHVVSDSKDILNTTDYEYNFVSALEKDNIFGVQYHPEKSHDSGKKIFKNFLDL